MKKTITPKQMIIEAARNMDWQQVVQNGGPPCFCLCEDGTFCGRSKRWEGHRHMHPFVSLHQLLKSFPNLP